MRLTTRSEYALLALAYLARHAEEGSVSSEVVARSQGIPQQFLQQILHELKRARLVKAHKGPHGGFQLARPAQAITLAEVIRLFDGALAPTESVSRYFYEPSPIEAEQRLLCVLREIRDYISEKLEGTTLKEIL